MAFPWKRQNRRKANRKADPKPRKLPALNVRRWGLSVLSVALITGAGGALCMYLDQPIERVQIAGRFQRVSPGDVERAVKDEVRGEGLVSVDLAAVRAAVRSAAVGRQR